MPNPSPETPPPVPNHFRYDEPYEVYTGVVDQTRSERAGALAQFLTFRDNIHVPPHTLPLNESLDRRPLAAISDVSAIMLEKNGGFFCTTVSFGPSPQVDPFPQAEADTMIDSCRAAYLQGSNPSTRLLRELRARNALTTLREGKISIVGGIISGLVYKENTLQDLDDSLRAGVGVEAILTDLQPEPEADADARQLEYRHFLFTSTDATASVRATILHRMAGSMDFLEMDEDCAVLCAVASQFPKTGLHEKFTVDRPLIAPL